MKVADLFKKRIAFMTGKGGVGKTTVSAALALAARDMGKNVLLVEVDESPTLRYIFNREIPVYKEITVAERLTVLTLDPDKALEEYVILQIKVAMAARMILNNRIFQYFMQAAPGWRELVTVGKIWYEFQQTTGRGRDKRPRYDMIVVDSPATGHGVSFLKVPSVFLNILKIGWMQGQAGDLQKMLTDGDTTVLNVVTLPEEMPVNEAAAMREMAQKHLGMTLGVTFVNGVHEALFDAADDSGLQKLKDDAEAMERLASIFPDRAEALFSAESDRRLRAGLSRHYLDQANERIGPPLVSLSHQHMGRVDFDGVKIMAAAIKKAADGGM
ncbi:MAG: ArsA family ATPase [Deltaproteobacteria bacterium]|nr:ArsA family ATPase [Deltaproteobacteria bacterium]